jgi:hypothetical protein
VPATPPPTTIVCSLGSLMGLILNHRRERVATGALCDRRLRLGNP